MMDLKNILINDESLKNMMMNNDEDYFCLTNNNFLEKQIQALQHPNSPDTDTDSMPSLDSSNSSLNFSNYFHTKILEKKDMQSENKPVSFLEKLEQIDESLKQFLDKTSKFASEVNLLEYKSHQLSNKDMSDMDMEIGDDAIPMNCLGYGLFSFICTHLENPDSSRIIDWVNKSKRMFEIRDPTMFAKLWGEEKKKEGMNPKKLYRSLNYLVENKGQMKKTNKKFVYIIANKSERQFHNEKRKQLRHKKEKNVTTQKTDILLENDLQASLNNNINFDYNFNSYTDNYKLHNSVSKIENDQNNTMPCLSAASKVTSTNITTPPLFPPKLDSSTLVESTSSFNQLPSTCDDLENIEPTLGNIFNQSTPSPLHDDTLMSAILRKYIEFS